MKGAQAGEPSLGEEESGPARRRAALAALDLQSAHAHIDWATTQKITLATAGGARLTLQASGLTVECPGTIRVQAAQKRMVGAEHVSQTVQTMPKADIALDQEFVLFLENGEPAADRQFELHFEDGASGVCASEPALHRS